MKAKNIIAWSIIIISFIVAIYLYFSPAMPDKLVGHWNAKGEPDGYLSKFWGLFLMPLISLLMLFLFRWLPKIDPLKENVQKFREHYDNFIVLLLGFLLYLYILTIAWNTGLKFNMVLLLVPGFAMLFYYTGAVIENTKRNWFIGIRTPWTMSSDAVWEKTHDLGGKLFKVSAIIALFGVFVEKYALHFVLGPIIISVIAVITYSYFEYKKHHKQGN